MRLRRRLLLGLFVGSFVSIGTATPVLASSLTFTLFSTAYPVQNSGFAVDPVTGAYYERNGFGESGQTVNKYDTLAAFAANTPSSSVTLTDTGLWGTYFAVNNGNLFGRTDKHPDGFGRPAGTDIDKWDATGAALASLSSIPGMGGVNGPHTFDWGGFSAVNVMQDQTGLYVFGHNLVGADWQLNHIDQNLNILGTRTYTPDDARLGFAFMINGNLFTGPDYDNNAVTQQLNFATGTLSNLSLTLDGLGTCCYLSNFAYDPVNDRLFAYNTRTSSLYSAAGVAAALGVTPQVDAVPEPASLLLLGTGLAAAGARRYRQRK